MLTATDFINDEVKMREISDLKMFNKTEGANKIYQKKEYIILEVKKGYIVYNIKKEFENGHTHLRSFQMAKTVIDNSISKKRPKTNDRYLLESHIRITCDSKYKKTLEEILTAKLNKTKDNKYYNRSYYSLC